MLLLPLLNFILFSLYGNKFLWRSLQHKVSFGYLLNNNYKTTDKSLIFMMILSTICSGLCIIMILSPERYRTISSIIPEFLFSPWINIHLILSFMMTVKGQLLINYIPKFLLLPGPYSFCVLCCFMGTFIPSMIIIVKTIIFSLRDRNKACLLKMQELQK